MNKQQVQSLVGAIQKIVAAEVKSQMITLRTEITRHVLAEVKRNTGYSDRSMGPVDYEPEIRSRQPVRKQTKVYSSNPLLNEVLSQTEMNMDLLRDEPDQPRDENGRVLNITTQDSSGRQVNLKNPAVQSVLEAMNKQYDVAPVSNRKSNAPAPIVNADVAKNYAKGMMEITDDDIDNGNIYIPDPFSEEGR